MIGERQTTQPFLPVHHYPVYALQPAEQYGNIGLLSKLCRALLWALHACVRLKQTGLEHALTKPSFLVLLQRKMTSVAWEDLIRLRHQDVDVIVNEIAYR